MTGDRPGAIRQALWWAADYLYAARRQLSVVSLPWTFGRPRPAPPAWAHGAADLPEVVLLPGVYEHWTFLRPLGDALSAAGHRVVVIHGLGVNRRSIPETSERLGRLLAAEPLPPAGRVLVAHSKGGLIAKHLLVTSGAAGAAAGEASAGGDPAEAAASATPATGGPPLGVLGLVAVATPFRGARRARLFLDPSIRAFLPGDETIVMLGRETSINGRIVSVFGPYDAHIPEGSALEGATNVAVPTPGHFRVLGSPKTHAAVLEGIRLLTAE
ncbi:esterase/lipase family protein [Microbacterium flavescens]|jgi:hypothetical protein|uniref:esterase/lipase family protein n=1 Tax=Microbacterium flavescens TaxID=69366 RepID=UPI001BDEB0CD|nr:alpha/beta hydrolase [Microbacterium flavescens]BFF10196.1 hypothetical protein GCM10025699_14990 [Microbacterium flavescens]